MYADLSTYRNSSFLFARYPGSMLIPLKIASKSVSIVDLSAWGKLFIGPVYSAGIARLEAAEFAEDAGKRYSDP